MMKQLFTLATLSIFFIFQVNASHIAGGSITYRNIGAKKYVITLELYRNCDGGIELCNCPGGPQPCAQNINVSYKDSTGTYVNIFKVFSLKNVNPKVDVDVLNLCSKIKTVCTNCGTRTPGSFVPAYEKYVFFDTLDLTNVASNICVISLSYTNCCMQSSISNISNPASSTIFISSELNLCLENPNNSIVFTENPLFTTATDNETFYVPSVKEPDGDELIHSFTPINTNNTTIAPYTGINDSKTNLVSYLGYPNYNAPSPLGIRYNSNTGALNFQSTNKYSNIVQSRVEEWRYEKGRRVFAGAVNKVYTINSISGNNSNEVPVIFTYDQNNQLINPTHSKIIQNYLPQTIYAQANNQYCYTFSAADGYLSDDAEDTTDIWISLPFDESNTRWGKVQSTYLYNTSTRSINGPKRDSLKFCWTPSDSAVRSTPFYFYIHSRDHACPVKGMNTQVLTMYVNCYTSPIAITGNTTVNYNSNINYSTPLTPNTKYKWTVINGKINGADSLNTVSIYWQDQGYGSLILQTNDAAKCPLSSRLPVIVVQSSGIEEKNNHIVSIYPNPVKDLFKISLDDIQVMGDIQAIITNMEGKIVQKEIIHSNSPIIDVHNLDNGMYILQFMHSGKKFSVKFIKN